MTGKQRKQEEARVEDVLQAYFGEHYKYTEFYYSRKMKAMLVTYEDFKTERIVKSELMEVVGKDWKVVLKREFSDLTIMLTMLKLYKENRVAIADMGGGDFRPYIVREYVNSLMEKC